MRGREIAVPELRNEGVISRRAMLAHVLGVAGLLTVAAAAISTLARGSFQATAHARAPDQKSGRAA